MKIMMQLKTMDQKFIFVTSVLVLLMGIETFHSLAVEDLSSAQVLTTNNRQPASVQPVFSEQQQMPPTGSLDKLAHQDLKWDLNCQKKITAMHPFRVKTDYVQIQGHSCVQNFDQNRMTIVNQSNGFTASVFEVQKNQYETDLIQLKEGDNKILIQYQDPSGHKIEQLLSVVSTHI